MSKTTTSKSITKVSKDNFQKILEDMRNQGVDLSGYDETKLQDKGVVSSGMRTINSYQIKDKNGNYFRSTLSFSPVEKGKGISISYSKEMDDFKRDFEKLKEKYSELMTTQVSNPLRVKK